jgi:hypothetical protein
MLWYNKKKRFVLKNDYLFTHESENGEYGNEQSIQYHQEVPCTKLEFELLSFLLHRQLRVR